ncbi:MAG: carboxymuconolactone decarboxylase family protein [Anaerolineales bacterium]|nr:carboxymuconolactone decarboxylase family protein [Anaerolineales bacterium]
MKPFDRRTYQSLKAFLVDFKEIMTRRDQMKPLMRGEIIDGAFRERLMLAITAVNGCRYCSYAHARMALVEGIGQVEVTALQEGGIAACPEDELPGLLYAQHWAETQGQPNPAARERIVETYTEETVQAIELTLRTIQMGNLLGNTLDYILYRLSFGRWGGRRGVSGTEKQ